MPLLFGEIRKLVAPYAGRAGKCADAAEVALFARQVLEYLLYSGSEAGVRKVCITAYKGCFSLPPEVEMPIKARIDGRAGEVQGKWVSFHSAGNEFDRCPSAADLLMEDGQLSPLVASLPEGGSIVGVRSYCKEAEEAFVLVQGKDITGRPIYTLHGDEQVPGERFRLIPGQVRYGKVRFGEITSVLKSKTNGYVGLFAVDPEHQTQRFLADWSPMDEKPLYRRFRVASRDCPPIARISMLCRVRIKDNYHDNEVTFFDNSLAVTLAAQRVQSEANSDAQTASYKKTAVDEILEREAGYKKISGNPIDVYHPLSGGAIKGIV